MLSICTVSGENLERRVFWSQTSRSWKFWTPQKSVLGDSMQRRSSRQKMVKTFVFPMAGGTVKLSGRDQVFRTSIRVHPARGEEDKDDLQGESDGSWPSDTMTDDSEAPNDFWSIEGNWTYRRHVEPRVKLYVLGEESFPTPLRYIDVIRRTHTALDVLQESRIVDYSEHWWRSKLIGTWTRFTQCTTGRRKFKQTTRLDHLWPEIWSGMSKSSSTKGKAAVGYRETEARKCAKVETHLFHWSGWWGVYRNHEKRAENVGIANRSSHAL